MRYCCGGGGGGGTTSGLFDAGKVRSTAANRDVIGGNRTGSGGLASSSGRLPIDWTDPLRDVIPLLAEW